MKFKFEKNNILFVFHFFYFNVLIELKIIIKFNKKIISIAAMLEYLNQFGVNDELAAFVQDYVESEEAARQMEHLKGISTLVLGKPIDA